MLARLGVLPGTTAVWGSSPGRRERDDADVGELRRRHAARRLHAVHPRGDRRDAGGGGGALLGQPAPPPPPVAWLAAPDWPWLAATLALAAGSVLAGRWCACRPGRCSCRLVLGVALQNAGLLEIELPPLLLAVAYARRRLGRRACASTARSVRHAARALPAVLASIVGLVAICAGFAALLVVFAGIDPLTAYLAMSPGGADTVAIIASSTQVDVAFVMAMQTARLLFVLLTGPCLARFIATRVAPAR